MILYINCSNISKKKWCISSIRAINVQNSKEDWQFTQKGILQTYQTERQAEKAVPRPAYFVIDLLNLLPTIYKTLCIKLKIEQHVSHNRGELGCPGRGSSSFSTSGTHHVAIVTNPVINHEWG
jgi:hypothetical protein